MLFNFLKDAKTIVAIVISAVVYIIYLNLELGLLNKKVELLKSENALIINEKALCQSFLDKQNKAIDELKLDVLKKPNEPKEVEKIKKIYIKDKSCESELKAYKELFGQ
ncbi:hypothetical protein [Campylobacter blaseri]|nr:hypothetical protein [Campylobacter blaseri]